MNNQLTLKDAQKYQNLIARQFNEIARSLVLSNDETWELFLKQKETEFLDPVHLHIIKRFYLVSQQCRLKTIEMLYVPFSLKINSA